LPGQAIALKVRFLAPPRIHSDGQFRTLPAQALAGRSAWKLSPLNA
jgi:hypothetical protein